MQKHAQLSSGKTKTLFNCDDPRYLIVHFRDDATAFNGVKKMQLHNKGVVNNHFNAFIMQKLEQAGIATHFERLLTADEALVKNLDMIRVECVVRNWAAGSLCRHLGVSEGLELQPPIFEFFLKNDELNDPMINEDHIRNFGWATSDEVAKMRELTFKVNEVLKPLFAAAGMMLIDYKLEFGRDQAGNVILGDEFTPDGCRIWDKETRKVLDKDRFRRDMGEVIEGYQEAAQRLGIHLPA